MSKVSKQQLRERRKAYIWAYKAARKCERCGEGRTICLDLHHKGDKRFGISRQADHPAYDVIDKELARCVVLCANCHRIATFEERVKDRPEAPLPLFADLT